MPRTKNNDADLQRYADQMDQRNVATASARPIPGIEPIAPQGGTTMTSEDAASLIDRAEANAGAINNRPPVTPSAPTRNYGDELEAAQEERKKQINEEIHANGLGYLPIDVQTLPTKGIFYPTGTKLFIRAATGGEIRHWSQTNETELSDIDDSLNYILERCLSVKFPDSTGLIADYKDLKEIDRFYVILAIRDFTFPDGNNELMIKITEKEQIPLKKDNIDFIKFENKIMKFYDAENKCFTIQNFTSKQGRVINLKKPLHIYMPSVGVDKWLKSYLQKKTQMQEMIDQDFLKMAPLLIRDHRGLNDETYRDIISSCDHFGIAEYSIIEQFRRVLTAASNPKFIYRDKEGMEQTAPLNFQGGIKSLFLYSMDELI